MFPSELESLVADFHTWLNSRAQNLSDIDDPESLIRAFLVDKNYASLANYIGDINALSTGKVYKKLTDELIRLGVKSKVKLQSDVESDILERYKTVPLHAVFLYTSEDNEVSKYILENWGALDTLSGDYCDIHPSVDQFENTEDAYDLIEKMDILRNTKFNSYSQLPGIFFWDLSGATEYISFGNEFSQATIRQIVRIIFEEIRKAPNIHSVSKAKTIIEDKNMPTKYKSSHASIWSDISAFLLAFVVIIGTLVLASRWVSPLILGIVFIAAILVFLLVSALVLRRQQELTETNFMILVKEVIKRLPLLRQISKVEGDKK
jgi:hypothetical protein